VFHGDVAARTEALGRSLAKVSVGAQLADTGMGEFLCSRIPDKRYRVIFGYSEYLECNCEGFCWRGGFSHVWQVKDIESTSRFSILQKTG
jgi:hypothetical protein